MVLNVCLLCLGKSSINLGKTLYKHRTQRECLISMLSITSTLFIVFIIFGTKCTYYHWSSFDFIQTRESCFQCYWQQSGIQSMNINRQNHVNCEVWWKRKPPIGVLPNVSKSTHRCWKVISISLPMPMTSLFSPFLSNHLHLHDNTTLSSGSKDIEEDFSAHHCYPSLQGIRTLTDLSRHVSQSRLPQDSSFSLSLLLLYLCTVRDAGGQLSRPTFCK